MTFVILISARSWWFEGVNLLSSPLLSIFGGSIFAKSSDFVFDKINWSGTEMRFQIDPEKMALSSKRFSQSKILSIESI